MSGPTPLAYAPPPRRRRWVRWAAWLIAVAIAIAIAMPIFDRVSARGRLLSEQRALQNLSASPDLLVYGEEADATAILDQPEVGGYNQIGGGYVGRRDVGDGRPPARYAARWLSAVNRLQGRIAPAQGWQGAVLFAHQRTTPGGTPQIVVVQLPADSMHFNWADQPMSVSVILAHPLTFFGSDQYRGSYSEFNLSTWPPPGTATRFFAGQPHPTDASRFSIPYAVGGVPGFIDGALNDDLTATLTVRDGPLANPTTRNAE